TVYFKGTVVGTVMVTASTARLSSATQQEFIQGPAATQLAFASAAQALKAGACSAIVTVQSQDASGNAANVSVNTTVSLSAAPAAAVAGACSSAATVEARDGFGNVSPVTADTAIALSASPGAGLGFYAGTACAGPVVTSITMPAGASSATFSFQGTRAGPVTLT